MQSDAVDSVAAMAARPEWRVIEKAGTLAHHGRHMEAEATRHAAQYHNLKDSKGRHVL